LVGIQLHVVAWLEELGKLKKSNDIGTPTRDLLACSVVSQPTMLPGIFMGRGKGRPANKADNLTAIFELID
jgi:hypothetical protein